MTLYGLCILLVVFGATLAVLDLLIFVLTPALLARIAHQVPRHRASTILALRSLPVAGALLLSAFVFLPAWMRHEPSNVAESVSGSLLALAFVAVLPVLLGMRRGAVMFLRTRDRLVSWRGQARSSATLDGRFEMLEVTSTDLALCVGGYLTPTIYASTEVMNSLESEEISAALAHEVSHARTRDPLRLLWMGSCPDFLQLFRLDDPWRRAFSSACEFAADEGASRGDREVALDLASALLKVARLRASQPLGVAALRDVAVSSAYSSRVDLEARVSSLVNPAAHGLGGRFTPWPWKLMLVAATLAVCGTVLLGSGQVHAVTEAIGRFLSAP